MLPRVSLSSRLVLAAGPAWAALLWLAASGLTCANGSPAGTGAAGGSASAASSSGSTSSSSGSGGGGASTSASSGGTGGGTSASASSAASTTASSSSTTTTSSSSGTPTTLLQMYAITGGVAASAYDEATMMADSTVPYTETTTTALGLAGIGDGTGAAVIRSEPSGEPRYARWTGTTWSPGSNMPFLPVMSGLTIMGGPALAGSSTMAHCAYQGTDTKLYYSAIFNGSWFPINEAVTAGGTQSVGAAPPAVTTLADVPIIAFVSTTGDLVDQARTGGTWQTAHAHGLAGQVASVTPAIVAPTQGPELLVVFTEATSNALEFTARTAGTWSTPAAITGATSTAQVSVAPLAAGGAVLAYLGTDGLLYTSLLSAGAAGTWSAPVAGVMGSSPTLQGPPSVATGASGAQAELLFLDNTGVVRAARMTGGAWGAATTTGVASNRVAVATTP